MIALIRENKLEEFKNFFDKRKKYKLYGFNLVALNDLLSEVLNKEPYYIYRFLQPLQILNNLRFVDRDIVDRLFAKLISHGYSDYIKILIDMFYSHPSIYEIIDKRPIIFVRKEGGDNYLMLGNSKVLIYPGICIVDGQGPISDNKFSYRTNIINWGSQFKITPFGIIIYHIAFIGHLENATALVEYLFLTGYRPDSICIIYVLSKISYSFELLDELIDIITFFINRANPPFFIEDIEKILNRRPVIEMPPNFKNLVEMIDYHSMD